MTCENCERLRADVELQRRAAERAQRDYALQKRDRERAEFKLDAERERAEEALRLAGPQFPLQKQSGIPEGTIPLWIAAAAYHSYQEAYGSSQTLKLIGERGGFGAEELLALLLCRDQHGPRETEFDRAKHLLAAARAALAQSAPAGRYEGCTDLDGKSVIADGKCFFCGKPADGGKAVRG